MSPARSGAMENLRRSVIRRSAAARTEMPYEPVVGIAAGLVLLLVLLAARAVGTQPWLKASNPPEMDLSRRVVFGLSSALELYGAGLVGFAMGLGAAQRRAAGDRSAARRARRLGAWRFPLVLVGVALILIAGRSEYLALTAGIP